MDQPAHSEEDLCTDPNKSATKMAPERSRPYCSPYRKLPPIDFVEDELARDLDPVESLHLGSTSSAPSCNPTPALILTLVVAPIPTPAAINDLFKKFMKTYLEKNQGLKQPRAERK